MSELRAEVRRMQPRDDAHLALCCVMVCRERGMSWTTTRALSDLLFKELS